jgi:hypothetical protein
MFWSLTTIIIILNFSNTFGYHAIHVLKYPKLNYPALTNFKMSTDSIISPFDSTTGKTAFDEVRI